MEYKLALCATYCLTVAAFPSINIVNSTGLPQPPALSPLVDVDWPWFPVLDAGNLFVQIVTSSSAHWNVEQLLLEFVEELDIQHRAPLRDRQSHSAYGYEVWIEPTDLARTVNTKEAALVMETVVDIFEDSTGPLYLMRRLPSHE